MKGYSATITVIKLLLPQNCNRPSQGCPGLNDGSTHHRLLDPVVDAALSGPRGAARAGLAWLEDPAPPVEVQFAGAGIGNRGRYEAYSYSRCYPYFYQYHFGQDVLNPRFHVCKPSEQVAGEYPRLRGEVRRPGARVLPPRSLPLLAPFTTDLTRRTT